MHDKHLGAGKYYLFAIQDRNGSALDGRDSYRLHVPLNVPGSCGGRRKQWKKSTQ